MATIVGLAVKISANIADLTSGVEKVVKSVDGMIQAAESARPSAISNTVSADSNWSKWQRIDSRTKSIFDEALQQDNLIMEGCNPHTKRYRVRKDGAGYEYHFERFFICYGDGSIGESHPPRYMYDKEFKDFYVRVDESGNVSFVDKGSK